jgi:hypothetical protein
VLLLLLLLMGRVAEVAASLLLLLIPLHIPKVGHPVLIQLSMQLIGHWVRRGCPSTKAAAAAAIPVKQP